MVFSWRELPPTPGQIIDITRKCIALGIRPLLEELPKNRMEARNMQYDLRGKLRAKGKTRGSVPTGTCYPDAWRYTMRHAEEEPVLVHGSTVSLSGRLKHAWVELPDDTVWEPASQAIFTKEKFYSLVDPIVDKRYTVDEAASMLNVGYHGPWSDEERMKYIRRGK